MASEFDDRGELVARVGTSGNKVFTTRVRHDRYGLQSTCSCPIGVGCKHAVAAILIARENRAHDAGRGWETVLAAMIPQPAEGGTSTALGL